jgi:hypothetical protein
MVAAQVLGTRSVRLSMLYISQSLNQRALPPWFGCASCEQAREHAREHAVLHRLPGHRAATIPFNKHACDLGSKNVR